MAKQGWDLDQLKQRAHDSLADARRPVDEALFAKLTALLRYVDGDYNDPATFDRAAQAAGRRPSGRCHYLAIPPVLFETVVAGPGRVRVRRRTPASSSRSRSATTWPAPRS